MTHETPPKQITINLAHTEQITLKGWYRRDLEQTNWHYYETTDGMMLHCRKEHMIAVIESEIEEDLA